MNRGNRKVKIGCLFAVEKCRIVILLYDLIICFSYNIQYNRTSQNKYTCGLDKIKKVLGTII